MFGVADYRVEATPFITVVTLSCAFCALVNAPQFDGFVVSCENEQISGVEIQPLCGINVFIDFHAFEIIELGFVALEFRVVVIVVTRSLKDNKSSTPIAHTEVLPGPIEA